MRQYLGFSALRGDEPSVAGSAQLKTKEKKQKIVLEANTDAEHWI